MSYYDDKKNTDAYIKMAEGYDGRELIDVLRKFLKAGSTVLELGMGPGKDLELLSEHYQATGSDYAQPFLDRYQQINPEADLLLLDAVTLETDHRFDGIYSNKVLYHLTREDLKISLHRQAEIINDKGVLLHSFWTGEGEEEQHGLHFAYYTEELLNEVIGSEYKVLAMARYAEMEADDSIYLVLQKR